MIGRMSGLDGNESAAPYGANFPARDKFNFHLRAILFRLDHARGE